MSSPQVGPSSKIEYDIECLSKTLKSLQDVKEGQPIIYTKMSGEITGTFKSKPTPTQSTTHSTGKNVLGSTEKKPETFTSKAAKLLSQVAGSWQGKTEIDDPLQAARDIETQIKSIHDRILSSADRLSPSQLENCTKKLQLISNGLLSSNEGLKKLEKTYVQSSNRDRVINKTVSKQFSEISQGISKDLKEIENSVKDIVANKQIKKLGKDHYKKELDDVFSKREIAQTKMLFGEVVDELKSKPPTLKTVPTKQPTDVSPPLTQAPLTQTPVPQAIKFAAPPPPPPPPAKPKPSAAEAAVERRIITRLGDSGSFYTLSKAAEEKIGKLNSEIVIHTSYLKTFESLPKSEEMKAALDSSKRTIEKLNKNIAELQISGKTGVELSRAKELFSNYFDDELKFMVGAYFTSNESLLEKRKEKLNSLKENQAAGQIDENASPDEKEVFERKQRATLSEINDLNSSIELIEASLKEYNNPHNAFKKSTFLKSQSDWVHVLSLSGNMMKAIFTVLNERKTGKIEEPVADHLAATKKSNQTSSFKTESKKQGTERTAATVSIEDIAKVRAEMAKKKSSKPNE